MHGEWSGGKGSARRRGSDQRAYEDGWEKIFGKLDKDPEESKDKKNLERTEKRYNES